MLHIFYRASDSEKPEVRPPYYSKELSLKSLLNSLKRVKDYKLTLYYDSMVVPDVFRDLIKKGGGNIIKMNSLGNSGSFWHVFKDALKLPKRDWVYFVEDDYIHTLDSIKKLQECTERIKDADYITLFDHPVRYVDDYHYGLDLPHRNNEIYISQTHHWRTQESTTMTFASKVETLQEDSLIFDKYVRKLDVPEDRELFKRLQGLVGYEKGSPLRTLVGPIPSLATHCHIPWMAPIIEWEDIAKSV